MDGQDQAAAWNEWIDSAEGQRYTDPVTIGAPESARQYIRNRLWWAFMAGVRAAETDAARRSVGPTEAPPTR